MGTSEHADTALPYLSSEENDAIDLTGTEVLTPEPEEVVTSDTPEAEAATEETTDEAAPSADIGNPITPAPNLTEQMAQLVAMQTADMQRRQQEAAEQQRLAQLQAQQASAPKPLMEQEEWRSRYYDMMSRAPYDEDARGVFATMNRELAREEAQAQVATMREELRLEMRGDNILRSAATSARQQYGDLISDADFNAVAAEVFGDNPAAIARALDPHLNPNADRTREILAQAAAGRAFLSGRAQQPARPTPPPNPRTGARAANPTKPTKTAQDMWNDPNYLDGVMGDVFSGRKTK